MKRHDRPVQLRLHAEVQEGGLQVVYVVMRPGRHRMWVRIGAGLLGRYTPAENEATFREDMARAWWTLRRHARNRYADPPTRPVLRVVV